MATKRKPAVNPDSIAERSTVGPRASNEPPIDGGRTPAEIVALAERTVNGHPVSALPDHVRNLITYAMTDQGIAEKNAANVDSQGRPHTGAKVTLNEGFDQSIARRNAATEPWECDNPLQDAATKYVRPGFRARGLSPRLIDKRTMRGFEFVKDARGENVKVGGLLLGEMPIEMANRRNEHYRRQGETELAASVERLKVDQERLQRDARSKGFEVGPLRDGDTLIDHGDPDRHGSIGVHSSRGLQGADAA